LYETNVLIYEGVLMSQATQSPAGKTEIYAQYSRDKSVFARIWRGQTKVEHSAEYADYLYAFGVLKIERMAGNLGVQMFREIGDDIANFMVISYWPSLQSISVWSGDDLTRTRHLERDPEFLLTLPERVTLVEVLANDWQLEAMAKV
jgi:heme-degrading monooxygenase HmoA